MAAAVATAVTAAFRLWIGGAGAWPGVANTAATALVGLVLARGVFAAVRPMNHLRLLLLGLASNLPLVFILLVPVHDAADIFLRTIGPMTLADTIGVMVLGRFLGNERRDFLLGRRLEAEASTDPLTLLPNRRSLDRDAGAMVEDARRDLRPVSMLVIDIDRFKDVNDRFGHDVGDVILKRVAGVVRGSVRVRRRDRPLRRRGDRRRDA